MQNLINLILGSKAVRAKAGVNHGHLDDKQHKVEYICVCTPNRYSEKWGHHNEVVHPPEASRGFSPEKTQKPLPQELTSTLE